MKKNFILMITILLLVFLSTGCVKSETAIDINKDKSVNLTITYLLSDNLENVNEYANSKEDFGYLEKKGYEVTDYTLGDMFGIKVTKTFNNIDDISVKENVTVQLSNFLNDSFDDSKIFSIEKGFFKNIYHATFIYDLREDSLIDYSSLIDQFKVSYRVNLPSKSINNNADIVSDNNLELTWNANYGKLTTVNYEFQIFNTVNVIMFVFASLIVVMLLIFIIYMLLRRRKMRDFDIQSEW